MRKKQLHLFSQGKKHPSTGKRKNSERGQVVVLMVISFTALLAFVGLVTDVGSVYVT